MKNGKYIEEGMECWYLNDKRHRTDGPAVTYPDGSQAWYLNGELHRTDGPAVIDSNGRQEWYLNGKEVKENIFNFILGCTMEELIPYIFGLQYKDYKPLVEGRLRKKNY
jgi:hypothetical protein